MERKQQPRSGVLTSSKTENLTQKDLEELARDKRNKVYKYEVPDDATNQFRPMIQVKYLAHKTIKAYTVEKTKNPTAQDHVLRKKIAAADEELLSFQKSHPQIFDMLTSRDTTNEQIVFLFNMIDMKELELRGQLKPEQATGMVQKKSMELADSGMTPDEWKRQQKK